MAGVSLSRRRQQMRKVHRSLHAVVGLKGIDRRLLAVAVLGGIFVGVEASSGVAGSLVFAVLLGIAWLTRADPQLPLILWHAWWLAPRYDAGKRDSQEIRIV